MPNPKAPTARRNAFVAWTGSRLIVWGGVTGTGTAVAGGGLYDDTNDAWSKIAFARRASCARVGAAVGWSGSELLVIGGDPGGGATNAGYAYDPVTNSWRSRLPTQNGRARAPTRSRS